MTYLQHPTVHCCFKDRPILRTFHGQPTDKAHRYHRKLAWSTCTAWCSDPSCAECQSSSVETNVVSIYYLLSHESRPCRRCKCQPLRPFAMRQVPNIPGCGWMWTALCICDECVPVDRRPMLHVGGVWPEQLANLAGSEGEGIKGRISSYYSLRTETVTQLATLIGSRRAVLLCAPPQSGKTTLLQL